MHLKTRERCTVEVQYNSDCLRKHRCILRATTPRESPGSSVDAAAMSIPIHLKQYIFRAGKGLATHLQEVPPFMHLLDVFICKNAACSLELTGALSGSPRDNWLMHTMSSQEKREQTKHNSRSINSLINEADAISNTGPGGETTYRISS